MDQEISNLQSTKKAPCVDDDFFPIQEAVKTYEYASKIIKANPKETGYADLTGRFPYLSSRGNEYICVLYDWDSNCILGEPIKNRQAKTIVDAWEKLHDILTRHGHPTNQFILDNECNKDLKAALKKHNNDFELTPPNMHSRNAVERAIHTLKNTILLD